MSNAINTAKKMVLSQTFEFPSMRGAIVQVVSGPCACGLLKVRAIGRKAPPGAQPDGTFDVAPDEVTAFIG
jgi:hypothetical protein